MNQKNKNIVVAFLLIIFCFLISGCLFFPQGSLYITSDPSGAEIYLNGKNYNKVTPALISNLSPGVYLLGLKLKDWSMSWEEYITIDQNQATSIHVELLPSTDYRALCIGINNYQDPGIVDLRAPSFDLNRMKEVFGHCSFGSWDRPFSSIDTLIGAQATRSNILNTISLSFSAADSSDVSYFYFSGHGWSDGNTSTILPYDALAKNGSRDITVDELAFSLKSIPGTKVVILDSCYSGGFIGKGYPEREMKNDSDLRQFNMNIIEAFSFVDYFSEKGNLASGEFKVITSASGDQTCLETLYHPLDGNPYGYFSAVLSEGCGYNTFTFPFPADVDLDRRVNLNEIYQFIFNSLYYLEQDVQVYPLNSSFVFVEY